MCGDWLRNQTGCSIIEKRKWLTGSYAWVMFDFGSASRDEGGKKGLNQKGLVTIDRNVIKDAYYVYKANWSKELFVHIAGKRYYNRAEKETSISVMSNIPEITLYYGIIFGKSAWIQCFRTKRKKSHKRSL